MFFTKKVVPSIYKLLLIAFIHLGGLVFAMDPSPENTHAITLLWQYAQSDQMLPSLEDLINRNSDLDINLPNSKKQTVLHIAALHGATSVLEFLLNLPHHKRIKPSTSNESYVRQLKINIDAQDSDSRTPLMIAISTGNKTTVELLIKAGAQVHKTDNDKFSNAFHYAYKSDKKIIQLLIKASKTILLDINAMDYGRDTPLSLAAMNGNTIAVETLLEAGASAHGVRIYDNTYTPLHSLVSWILACLDDDNDRDTFPREEIKKLPKYKKISRLLLKAGANMHILGNQSFMGFDRKITTPLRIAFDAARYFPDAVNSCSMLTELLSWHLYQVYTASARPEDIAAVQRLKNKYLESPKSQILREGNPFLQLIFTKLLDCTSKEQLIEKIVEYLTSADEEKQRIMLENMDYLLLKEDVLEELKTYFNLDGLKNTKRVFRHYYAKELKEKIFHLFDEDTLNALMNIPTIKNGTQHADILNTICDHLISYCNQAQIKTPFIRKIIKINQKNENDKIVELLQHGYFADKGLTNKEVSNILNTNVNEALQLIKDTQAHLDYIIQQDGNSLSSSTRFGGEDILNF